MGICGKKRPKKQKNLKMLEQKISRSAEPGGALRKQRQENLEVKAVQ